MLLLWDIPLSPYAQKIKLALIEKGIPYETREPNFDAPEAEFLAASPRLEVPALIDGDAHLFDSSVILEYLEDKWPETPLLPAGALERARVRTLEEICDTAYDAVNWGAMEITGFGRAKGERAAQLLEKVRSQVAGLNARLERELEGREWLNGERFGFGDVAVYPFVNSAASLGNKPAPDSRLESWLKSVRARAGAERIRQDIKVSLPRFMNRPRDVAEGRHRREYRDHRIDWLLRSGGLDILVEGVKQNNIRFSRDWE